MERAKNRPQTGARASFEGQIASKGMVVGTPDSVVPQIREILEYLRPGIIIFRTGDGAMTHEDQMRTLKLMGEDVMPWFPEICNELGLNGPDEVDPMTAKPLAAVAP